MYSLPDAAIPCKLASSDAFSNVGKLAEVVHNDFNVFTEFDCTRNVYGWSLVVVVLVMAAACVAAATAAVEHM